MLTARLRPGAVCPLCRDTLTGAGETRCVGCGTRYHDACHAELGGCGTLGCRKHDVPAVPAAVGEPARLPVERFERSLRGGFADDPVEGELAGYLRALLDAGVVISMSLLVLPGLLVSVGVVELGPLPMLLPYVAGSTVLFLLLRLLHEARS